MVSHIFIGVSDLARALAFYRPVLAALGWHERFCDPARPWAGWHPPGAARPLFVIGHPHDGQPHAPGNGQMVAFAAASHALVRAAHAAALRHGGCDEGAPGPRPQYHAHYDGAYFCDPDGNKFGVACHEPPAG